MDLTFRALSKFRNKVVNNALITVFLKGLKKSLTNPFP